MLIEKILGLSERGYDVTLSSDHVSETLTIVVMKGRMAVRQIITEELLYTSVFGVEGHMCMIIDDVVEGMERENV